MPTPSVRPALPARAPYAPAPSGTPRAALPDRTGIRIDQPPAARRRRRYRSARLADAASCPPCLAPARSPCRTEIYSKRLISDTLRKGARPSRT